MAKHGNSFFWATVVTRVNLPYQCPIKNWTTPILSLFVSFCQQNLPQQFRLPKLPIVAQKTAQCLLFLKDSFGIGCWHNSELYCWFSHKLQHPSLNLVFGSCDLNQSSWEVLDQTTSLLIGPVFWVSIIFPEFCLLYSNRRQRNSHGNSKQCHATLCVSIWPVEIVSTASSWHLTTYHYEIHFYCSTFFCHFSHHQIQARTRQGYCG